MPVTFKNQCKNVRAPESEGTWWQKHGIGKVSVDRKKTHSWCLTILLNLAYSQVEDISLFHVLLSVQYHHLKEIAKLDSSAYLLFYHGKCLYFKVSGLCHEAPVILIPPETYLFIYLFIAFSCWYFISHHTAYKCSNLHKARSGNSNDVGRSKDSLNILPVCLPGSKTPVLLMENLTCLICIFSSTSSSSSGLFYTFILSDDKQ